MTDFIQLFETVIPQLKTVILQELKTWRPSPDFDFTKNIGDIGSKAQQLAVPVIKAFLKEAPFNIQAEQLVEPKDKNTYPDLEIAFENSLFALDIKTGENKNPAFDMGRIDNYEETHIAHYKAEYCIIAKWKNRDPGTFTFTDVYIEEAYKAAGFMRLSGGVEYRKKDGNIRPKSWKDSTTGKSHWTDLDHFRQGLETSKNFRQPALIIDWYTKMSLQQRAIIRQKLDEIDQGAKVHPEDADLGGE